MEQSPTLTKTQEESVAVADLSEAITQQAAESTSDATKDKTETTAPEESTRPEKEQVNQKINLLYEQCLGFIPGSLSGKRDPRYESSLRIIRTLTTHMKIFCKFWKRPTSSNI